MEPNNKDIKVIIDNEYNFGKNITINPTGNYSLGLKDINEINKNLQLHPIKNYLEYFEKFLMSLKIKNPKSFIFSERQIKDYKNYLYTEIKKTFSYPLAYFIKLHKIRRGLYSRITTSVYKDSTVTGRMKIISGVNFLTTKKEERKNIFPVDKNNILLEVDFKSCEPNFYCRINNIHVKKDLYLDIIKNFNLEKNREKIKRGVLTLIYGGSNNLVKKFINTDNNTLDKIKTFLKIKNFNAMVNNQIEEKGYMLNFYGRPILSVKNPLNYYIQSSTADYCCFAFENFIKNNPHIKLHALIHDAMIISCNKNHLSEIFSYKSLIDPISNIEIPITIRNLNEKKESQWN